MDEFHHAAARAPMPAQTESPGSGKKKRAASIDRAP
jgi:hypothetical protein